MSQYSSQIAKVEVFKWDNDYVLIPEGNYSFVNTDDASVVRISDDFVIAYAVNGDASVEFNDEDATVVITNASSDAPLDFTVALQNVDGDVVVCAEGTMEESKSISVSVDFELHSAEITTDSDSGNIETTLEIDGAVVDQNFHIGHTPGDINNDGKVNNKDLTRLFQYLSNWEVEVVDEALDINGDGKVNNKDLTRLFQYLSNWDVEIF